MTILAKEPLKADKSTNSISTDVGGAGAWLASRGIVAAAVVGAASYAALSSGVLPGPVALTVAATVLLAVPVDRSLSRRVAVTGALVLGWVPITWWRPLPWGLNHGALLVAVVLSLLAAFVVSGRRPRHRLRQLVPVPAKVDWLLMVAAVAGWVATWKLALAGSPERALSLLLPGADNWVHFDIFSTMRLVGSSIDAASMRTTDGSGWGAGNYPSAYHAIAATISEISRPGLVPGPDSVLAFAHAVVGVVVLVIVVLTAGVVSLPWLRKRTMVALPVGVVVWVAFLLEPGQKILANGFAGFWVAAAATALSVLLALGGTIRWITEDSIRVREGALVISAVGGLLMTVAGTWTLLLVPAGASALLLAVGAIRMDRTRVRLSRHPRILVAALLVLSVLALGVVRVGWRVASSVPFSALLTSAGGLDGTSPLPTFLLLLVAGVVTVGVVPLMARHGGPELASTARQVRWVGCLPVLAVALGTVLMVAQIHVLGTTGYYFLKYMMGVELVLAAVVPAVVGLIVACLLPRQAPRAAVPVGLLAGLMASQSFGITYGVDPMLLSETNDGTASIAAPYSRGPMASGIIRAAETVPAARSVDVDYVALGRRRAVLAFYPDAWFHAVNASLSGAAHARVNALSMRVSSVEDAVPAIQGLLTDPRVTVLVDHQYLDELRSALGPRLAPRLKAVDGN